MLVRGSRRLVTILGLFFLSTSFLGVLKFYNGWSLALPFWDGLSGQTVQPNRQPQSPLDGSTNSRPDDTYREIFSVSTADKKYFLIKFGDQEAMNPNIIPHPVLENTWIIVAQQIRRTVEHSVWCAELVCDAVFSNDTLVCVKSPLILPIAATFGDRCQGDLAFLNLNVGPHDARVFYGPKMPYAVYGSNSAYTCFGQWMQDFRMLVDWPFESLPKLDFRMATELQRPAPYGLVEKNWFVFWDRYDQMYAHYDIVPKRAFAKIGFDGSVGPDLAPLAASSDERCTARYMPLVASKLESIHQATNSLSITLCKRSDSSCEVNDTNTFIFIIFQHKSFYSFHSVYGSYIMVIKPTAPFEIYGISSKPIWIHGRGKPDGQGEFDAHDDHAIPKPINQSEMFYITSMSWKAHGQKYHGYIDDVLFISFGIEDSKTAGIDIVASDLFSDLGLCSAL
ncbi:MAG: hypothetical protein M1819_006969 [Sarea resinae]|nr:MAG: hypothetical protein M1819_006969 [Sarea resinae]